MVMVKKRSLTKRAVLYVGFPCNFNCRFCLTGDTKVLDSKFLWKDIKDVKKGDVVFGFEKGNLLKFTDVVDVGSRVDNVYKIVTDFGDVVATGDHRFLNSHGDWICVNDFLKSNNMCVGSSRANIRFLSSPVNWVESEDYMKGYISGVFGGGKLVNAVIKEIVPLGRKRVYNLETSIGCFWANGFASHNCYYHFNKSGEWKSLDDVKKAVDCYVEDGCDRVDITGGEPTIFPYIFELLDYCNEKGLRPSIITNAFVLKDIDKVRKFKDHGLFDFLVSVHGLGDVFEDLVQVPNSFEKLKLALSNLNEVGIPWRANCTITKDNVKFLKDICEFDIKYGARVVNFIEFNPFEEWEKLSDIDFQARHDEIRVGLEDAILFGEQNGIEVNVRYFPFCCLSKEFWKNNYNFRQLPFDSHEWSFKAWYDDRVDNPSDKIPVSFWDTDDLKRLEAKFNVVAGRQISALYFYGKDCRDCSLKHVCDGFKKQYVSKFGFAEARPIKGKFVRNVKKFICNQKKVVD